MLSDLFGASLLRVNLAREGAVLLPSTEDVLAHADGSRTWYRRTRPDSPRPGALPLVVLHGGPGMSHDYLRRLDELAGDGREVIQYDQVGCGRSSHHPDAGPEHWTVERFLAELEALLQHWDLRDGYHLLGQSWGGMLGAEHALTRPAGLASLVLLDSPASMPAWEAGTRRLVGSLPEDARRAIETHEATGSYDHPDYLAAVDVFYDAHLCRLKPRPDDLQASFDQLEQDPSVYLAMIGPSEFTITGSLRTWSVADRVGEIDVPTLVGYGEHDEATDSWKPFADVPGALVTRFDGASHTPHLETPDEHDRVVRSFLHTHDLGGTR